MIKLRPYQQEIVEKLKLKLRTSNQPLLVTASVGSGKSIIIAEIMKWLDLYSIPTLCLTLSSTLITQNAKAYGDNCGIYCSSLNSKDVAQNIIFASPNSICNAIKFKKPISIKPFKVVIVDECHNIDPNNNKSMYMRIFNHYAHLSREGNYNFRIIGLTGTPFRGKGISIIGESGFFKEEICNVDASYLINQGYLVKPKFNDITESYDFRNLRIKSNGKFDDKQLSEIVNSNPRLTSKIIMQIRSIIDNGRNGAFIFCSTRKHCIEAIASLPPDLAYIINGDTPTKEREKILNLARNGKVKYLLTVNCLMTGVDVPNFDTVAWLRPTESLVLYVQGIGRGLRLFTEKTDCLILDYAGNLDRHGDIDHQLINEAIRPKEGQENDYCIPCYRCHTHNKATARRCIGILDNKRCDYYFLFKDCPSCGVPNDQTSRECRNCHSELIDPNSKLNLMTPPSEYQVIDASYNAYKTTFFAHYLTSDGYISESYNLTTKRALNVFYANFVRQHLDKPSKYYPHLTKYECIQSISRYAKRPVKIQGKWNGDKFVIKKKEFL